MIFRCSLDHYGMLTFFFRHGHETLLHYAGHVNSPSTIDLYVAH